MPPGMAEPSAVALEGMKPYAPRRRHGARPANWHPPPSRTARDKTLSKLRSPANDLDVDDGIPHDPPLTIGSPVVKRDGALLALPQPHAASVKPLVDGLPCSCSFMRMNMVASTAGVLA